MPFFSRSSTVELDLELLEHVGVDVRLVIHDRVKELEDGVKDEHAKGTLQRLALLIDALGGPFLGGRVEVVVPPEALHHFGAIDTELLGITVGELVEGEGPSVETGGEGNVALLWGHLAVAECLVKVGRNDDVDGLDDTQEGGVHGLLCELQLEQGTIDLVDDEDGLDALGEGLTQHRLGLHAHALHRVDDDEGTVGDTQGGRDLGGEIDVSWGINQVDQEFGAIRRLLDVLEDLGFALKVH